MLQKKEEMKGRFIKAVWYPIFLFVVVLCICFVLFRMLIPHFLSLYSSLDIKFPYFTMVMISILKKIPFLFFMFAAFIVSAALLYFTFTKKMSPSRRISLLLRIPVLKRTVIVLITHQFSIQLGSLLKGGLAINEALKILEQSQYMRFFQTEAALMKKELVNGLRFEDIVAQKRYFVPELSMIIAHGQSYGSLGKELIAYSEILISYAEERMAKYIIVLQPVLFLFIGSMILAMFVSMLLPMFKMMDSIQ